jgi:hypothetical protein
MAAARLCEALRALRSLGYGEDLEEFHAGVLPGMEPLLEVLHVRFNFRFHPVVAHGRTVRLQKKVQRVLPFGAARVAQREECVGADGKGRFPALVAKRNAIPKRLAFLPFDEAHAAGPRSPDQRRVNVNDKQEMAEP